MHLVSSSSAVQVSVVSHMHAWDATWSSAVPPPLTLSMQVHEADADWHQPVQHEPALHPSMSDQARCFRQPFSRAVAALLARSDALQRRRERGERL